MRKPLLIETFVWLVAGFLLVTFYADLGELLWVGATAVKLAFFLIGLALFFRASADLYKARRQASVPLVLFRCGADYVPDGWARDWATDPFYICARTL